MHIEHEFLVVNNIRTVGHRQTVQNDGDDDYHFAPIFLVSVCVICTDVIYAKVKRLLWLYTV